MKKRVLLILAVLAVPAVAFGAGQADAGRDSVTAMVSEGSFVAGSYLDYEYILDDYQFPYEPQSDTALSVYLDVEKPLIPEWGDENVLQVSLSTAPKEFFPETDFDYVVFPYAEELFTNTDLLDGIKRALRTLLLQKNGGQRIWFFYRKEGALEELTAAYQIDRYLERAEEQLEAITVDDAVRRLAEAEKDLKAMLTSAGAGGNPKKYLWILDKPLANTANDFRNISGIISGYGNSSTEISFCGFGDSFRAGTINTFVRAFGGNSYYVNDGPDLEKTILDDFDFYSRPALNDLEICVYPLGAQPEGNALKEYRLVSMGPDEQHAFLTRIPVPSRLNYTKARLMSLGPYSAADAEDRMAQYRSYPLAYVTIRYFDQRQGKYVYKDMATSVEYTSDYEAYMSNRSFLLQKNLAILETYTLLGSVASQLSYGVYLDPVMSLDAHIRKLERLNLVEMDPYITEDISMLIEYKRLILENKGSLKGAVKSFRELGLRRY